jgi:hypothetical protein
LAGESELDVVFFGKHAADTDPLVPMLHALAMHILRIHAELDVIDAICWELPAGWRLSWVRENRAAPTRFWLT